MPPIAPPFPHCRTSIEDIFRHATAGLKGILIIKGKYYKLLQFADDTSLMLGSIAELKHAEKGIKKWCKATGMRERWLFSNTLTSGEI